MIGTFNNTRDFLGGWVEIKGKRKRFFDAIDELVDWKPLEKKLNKLYDSKMGRPSHPPLMVFKMLLVQHFYNLSDEGCEEAVNDSLSFRSFCGIDFTDKIPDATVLVRFRKKLWKRNLMDKLLDHVNAALVEKNVHVKSVTLIDASLVESPNKMPRKDTEPLDKEASFTVKRKKPHYGYKMHIATDGATNLILKADYTTAKLHDSQVFETLEPGDRPVIADKAYWSKARHESLGKRSLLMIRGAKNRPLNADQKRFNKMAGRVRGRIEGVFGYFKRTLGYSRARYQGLSPGKLELTLKCICWNLRRGVNLMQAN